MNTRVHRMTHPKFGPVSWRELQQAVNAIRQHEHRKVCSWCLETPQGRRQTRCDKKQCEISIGRLVDWATVKRVVLRDANFTCALCGRTGWDGDVSYECDHIVPVSLGGTGDVENLRCLCIICHRSETTRLRRLGADFIAYVKPTDGVVQ